MFGVGSMPSGTGLVHWAGQPGTGLPLLALLVNVSLLAWDAGTWMALPRALDSDEQPVVT